MKKIISFTLGAVLIFSSIYINDMQCRASDEFIRDNNTGTYEVVEETGNTFCVTNTMYENVEPAVSSESPFLYSFVNSVLQGSIYDDVAVMTQAVQEQMIMRNATVTATCYCDSLSDAPSNKQYVIDHIFDESSNPKGGDYLRWNWKSYSGDYTCKLLENGKCQFTINLQVEYLSTANQENEINTKVATLLSPSGAIGSQSLDTSYDKIQAVYDYCVNNFEYVSGTDKHSTYSALIENSTVCQGYATSIYLLLETLNVDCRLIASSSHGWNIAQIGDKYYYLDATWEDTDLNSNGRSYFLKGTKDFSTNAVHDALTEYKTESFAKRYPIADYVYKPSEDTTENTTENTTEDITENTTEATTNDSTTGSATTEDSTENTTENNVTEDEISTTEVSTEEITEASTEDNATTNSTIIYSDTGIVIIKNEGEAESSTTYQTNETMSTETWVPDETENPVYTVDAGETVVTPSNSSVITNTTNSENVDSQNMNLTETENDLSEITIDNKPKLVINGEVINNNQYEGTIKSFKIVNMDGTIDYYDNSGLHKGKSEVNTDTLQAIKLNSSKNLWYAVKTEQLGWLDYTSSEFAGTIGTDDSICGIAIASEYKPADVYTNIVGACTDFVDLETSPMLYALYDTSWGDYLSNGGVKSSVNGIKAVRIDCNDKINYKVKMGDKWLPEVTNWCLAGNPFGDSFITGLSISGNLKFRVKYSDGHWSEWYEGGNSVTSDDNYVIDIQIYQ